MFAQVLFIISAVVSLASAVGVCVTKNIMHACIYLLGTLIGVAGLYLSLGADFVAAVQLMVYVGGVVILMLFAVMLTGGKSSEGQPGSFLPPLMGNAKTYIIGGASAIVFVLSVYKLLKSVTQTYTASAGTPYESTVEKIGALLLTDHVLAFEISSVLLLGALIGAAIIARPRDKRSIR